MNWGLQMITVQELSQVSVFFSYVVVFNMILRQAYPHYECTTYYNENGRGGRDGAT